MDIGDFFQLTFAAAAIILALIQYQLMVTQMDIMRKQTALMIRQLELDEQQNAIIQNDLRKRADLILLINISHYDPIARTAIIVVSAKNEGNKSAPDFYWHIAVPQLNGIGITGETEELPRASLVPYQLTLDGQLCVVYRKHRDRPTYPTRAAGMCRITLSNFPINGIVTIRYKLVWEDGIDPEGEDYGTAELNLAMPPTG
jgi:hypothetical protein